MTRRERERLERRKAILTAALQAFSEHGFDAATVDEIAERAEFAKGTLYNYFPDGKEELFVAMFDEVALQSFQDIVESVFPEDRVIADRADLREALRQFVVTMILGMAENADAFRLLWREWHRIDLEVDIRSLLIERVREVTFHLESALAPCIEAGLMREMHPRFAAHLIMGNIRGLIQAKMEKGGCDHVFSSEASVDKVEIEESAELLASILLDGLLVKPEPAEKDAALAVSVSQIT